MSAPTKPATSSPAAITSGRQFLLLIFRYFAGYGVLFVCLLLLLRRPAWDWSAVDAVFWGTLLLLIHLHRRAALAQGDGRWATIAMQHLGLGSLLWLASHSGQLIA
jgi:hypothetical protein